MKNKKSISIRNIILINQSLYLLVLLFFMSITLFIYYEYQSEKVEKRFLDIKNEVVDEVNVSLEDAKKSLYFAKANLENLLIGKDSKSLIRINNSFKTILENNNYIYNIYFALSKDYAQRIFDQDAYVMTVTKNGDKSDYTTRRWYDPAYLTDPSEVWYHTSKRSSNVEFSPIYYDKTYMKQWMVSAVSGYFDEDEHVAMVGVDLLIDDIVGNLKEYSFGNTGRVLLVDSESGKVLSKYSDVNSDNLLSIPIKRSGASKLLSTEELKKIFKTESGGVEYYTVNNKDFVVSIYSLPSLNWTIIVTQEKLEAYGDLYRSLWVAFILLVFSFLIIFIFSRQVATNVVQPISQLTDQVVSDMEILKEMKNLQTVYPEMGFKETQILSKKLNELYALINENFNNYKSELTKNQELTRNQEKTIAKRTEDLDKALKAAEEANKVKSDFLAKMSHELRTPLNGILGIANYLSETTKDEDYLKNLKHIEESGERLLYLINDILDFTKLKSQQFKLAPKDFDLHKCVNTTMETLEVFYRNKKIVASVNIDSSVPEKVHGDEHRLKQVLYNLVGNAFKYTPKGQINLYLNLKSINAEGVQVEFVVQDTGIGIPEDEVDVLFEPFVQSRLNLDAENKGTGLGLAISKSLIHEMGGDISVFSKLNVGSEFVFNVFFKHANGDMQKIKDFQPGRDIKLPADFKVLVAEDNEISQKVISLHLKKFNASCDLAQDGQTAVDLYKKHQYDLIFMDISMPIMDGIEATKIIKAINPNVRIYALTANVFDEDKHKILKAGVDGVLLKPLQQDELLEVIKEFAL
ncbi:MAG: response regulator [Bdellovibrionales bacterium]|nr:response regulator [Bdellovibrionales bacterium]